MNHQLDIMVSGSAHYLYPMDTHYGLLWCGDTDVLEIPKRYPYQGEWGQCLSNCLMLDEQHSMPSRLSLLYLSLVEQRFYVIDEPLPAEPLTAIWQRHEREHGEAYTHIIVGMAPYGNAALWFYGPRKSTLLAWFYGTEIDLGMDDFLPEAPDTSLRDYCLDSMATVAAAWHNHQENGLPKRSLFEGYMKQFTYRYYLLFLPWDSDGEAWEEAPAADGPQPDFDYIEEALYDGTHDKLHDGSLMKFHRAGKPKKLAVQWHVKKSVYTAYFWFADEEIQAVFDRFYGAHPDTLADFMIRIDPRKNKYELALYRYGLKEPRVISESAYQILVFKNKYEYYRSKNYDQPQGAWIW